MASGETLGASFSIDTTNLKAGLSQANRMIRESESEFRAAAAGMDDWTKSSEGVSAKISQLNSTIDIQKKKVDALKSEYDRLVSDGLDPASKEAVELRTKINNETAALNKNEKELKNQTNALEDMGKKTEEASEKSDKMSVVVQKAGDGFSIAKGAIAGFIANGLTALVSKAGEAISSLLNLSESTQELRSSMARLETSFTTAGLTAEDATSTYNELYGVLGDSDKASEAAGHLSLLANNTKDLEAWTNIATGVYAQFGDSLPIEGLTEAANETAKVGDLTGVLADALNWAGVNEEDFQAKLDACSSEQERQQLITTTLNGLYSEQADKYRELNASVIEANEAQAALSQAQAGLGEAMQPLNTAITSVKASVLSEFTPALGEMTNSIVGMLNNTEGSTEQFSASFSEFINSILTKVTELIPQLAPIAVNIIETLVQGIVDNLPQITQSAIQIITMLANSLVNMLPTLVTAAFQIIIALIAGISQTLPQLIPKIIEAVMLIVQTLIDNIDLIINAGIQILVSLIQGISQMLPTLIPKIVEAVLLIVETLLDNIDLIIDAGIQLIIGLAMGLIDAIPILIEKLPTIISKLVEGIVNNLPKILEAGITIILELAKGLIKAIPQLVSKLPEIISSIVNGIKDGLGKLFDLGKDILGGIWEGIKSALGGLWDNVKGIGESIVGGFKSFFGIKSPSRLFRDEIGAYMGEGLALGIGDGFENEIDGVNKAIVKSMELDPSYNVGVNAAGNAIGSGLAGNAGGGIVVNQYNTFSQAHSRYEIFKSKQQTAAAVRLAMAGGI